MNRPADAASHRPRSYVVMPGVMAWECECGFRPLAEQRRVGLGERRTLLLAVQRHCLEHSGVVGTFSGSPEVKPTAVDADRARLAIEILTDQQERTRTARRALSNAVDRFDRECSRLDLRLAQIRQILGVS